MYLLELGPIGMAEQIREVEDNLGMPGIVQQIQAERSQWIAERDAERKQQMNGKNNAHTPTR